MSQARGLLVLLCLAARCSAASTTTNDQLLSMVTWAVQTVSEPLLGRQTSQQTQLDSLKDQLDLLAGLLSNLTDRQTGLEVLTSQQLSADRQQPLLDQLSGRIDHLESWRLQSSVMNWQSSNCTNTATPPLFLARDCSDLPAGLRSGIYLLQPGLDRSVPRVPAFCDQDTDGGGWTVFQRRADIQPRRDFFLGWQTYKVGFGELDMEFWWGLENVYTMTGPKDRRYELRIDMEDYEGGKRFAVYQGFRLSSERDGYRLQASNYSGTAGDSLSEHFGMKFSTKDKDHDTYDVNCAATRKGAWWYNRCFHSNLNGRHFKGPFRRGLYGTTWKTWRGAYYSLKTVEMKIRPTLKSIMN